MATKSIAWDSGGGYIRLTYTGSGNGTISVECDANTLGTARSQVITVKTTQGGLVTKNLTVNQAACPFPVGDVKNYSYTGTVQSVTLPAGTYKLQCWGAQGGSVSGTNTATGSKGGYSEGVLTLPSAKTVYIFVGGQGSGNTTSASAAFQNGGWNCGGGANKKPQYNGSGYSVVSYPACGGGATDICLTTSSMSYSNYVNNRSNASLLSRMIVAGGGAGGVVEKITTSSTQDVTVSGTKHTGQAILDNGNTTSHSSLNYYEYSVDTSKTYKVKGFGVPSSSWYGFHLILYYNGSTLLSYVLEAGATTTTYASTYYTLSIPSNCNKVVINTHSNYTPTLVYEQSTQSTTTYTSTGIGYGGGTQGGNTISSFKAGQDPTNYTDFGKGRAITTENYALTSGAAGGGWYGGTINMDRGTYNSSDYGGGGSGFVNTSANASHRPSGYTGLQLDSGETKAGNTSFPNTAGTGNETGHSGDGYCKITRLS